MTEPRRKRDATRPKFVEPSLDRRIAVLAARQHGVVALRQLEALGLARRTVAHRAAAGRLHRVHHGVYAVGHAVLGRNGRYMAAVLACGPGAALSHVAAADLWSIRRSDAAKVDVIVATAGGRSRVGLRIHRHPTLRSTELTTHRGIPVTTPARTLLDLAGTLQSSRLERVLDQAEILELTDYPALGALARAHPGHKGAKKLGAALATHLAGTTLTRSELEERFFALCDEHGLPRPKVNERVAGKEVDFLFAAERLIVETDSWQFHRTRHAFENDRTRDALLLTRGYRTLRVTHRALEGDPASVAATIATVLGA